MKQIIVIGSSNTDMVVKAAKLPGPGETILGGTFLMNPGGKGANQAMAAQRLGESKVIFIAKIGSDVFGQEAIDGFKRAGMDTRFVLKDGTAPSGIALISVDEQGENAIMVAPGANANLSAVEVAVALDACPEAELVLLQLEIPLDTVERSVVACAQKGIRVILNPAPARNLSDEILKHLYLITPNETEAELLTGVTVTDLDSARRAARILHDEKGVGNVIITLGAKGAFFYNTSLELLVPAPAVAAVDTTAAGDVFNGALVVALSEAMPLPDALAFACQAAALSVTRLGAQSSIPSRAEVNAALG
ncbi:ribokinase [Salmonirosea aquatica]|uniref:Ribokinase n=1 Tax=Salmonirosea aquatica TaxID=2654236 RepID=A0A7C9F6E6_9BACT|nr:ribokinase [Cytophagaceae bacterium SJW1-29]